MVIHLFMYKAGTCKNDLGEYQNKKTNIDCDCVVKKNNKLFY